MSTTYLLPDERVLLPGHAFTLSEIKYPRNWLELATSEDLEDRGIIKVVTPAPEQTPPLPASLLARLAGLRWDAENAGTTWGEIALPTDRERRSALKDAADKVRDGTLTSPIAVAFSAEVYAQVTLEQLDAAVNLITQHVQKVFSDALGVAAQIMGDTITTHEQLDAAWVAART